MDEAREIAKKFGKERILNLYKKLIIARGIETRVEREYEELRKKKLNWKLVVSAVGQEAGPTAICDFLRNDDYLIPAYRGVAAVLGKGSAPREIFAELLSLAGGPLKGIGNPGSFTAPSLGIFPNSDVLGNNFGATVGMGLALAERTNGPIVTMFFGDGASTRSTFYGALNLSALFGAPVLWVCENNKYSLATRYDQSSRTWVAEKAAAFGVRSAVVDGNDALKIFLRADELIRYVREKRRPALLELDTFRISRGSPIEGAENYIDESELNAWRARDPIMILRQTVIRGGFFSLAEIRELEETMEAFLDEELAAAFEYGRHSVDKIREILREKSAIEREPSIDAPNLAETWPRARISVVEALRQALTEEMDKDRRIVLFGEDVGRYGGRKEVSKGLLSRFGPRRVMDMPLNEELFVSMAIGLAQAGLRPIVEFAHASFLALAASDIHRSGFWKRVNLAKFNMPMVIRAVSGSGYGIYGEELAFSPISLFLNWKGIRMVMPSNAYQAKGLLKTALRSDSPIIFFEHRMLYKTEDSVPVGDYALPLEKGAIARSGKDVSILAHGYLTKLALEAAEILLRENGIDAEVVDLVSLKPLDSKLILSSAEKTKKIIIVDEEPADEAGLFSVIYALIKKELPYAGITGVGAENIPLPSGSAKAREFLPTAEKIARAARNYMF